MITVFLSKNDLSVENPEAGELTLPSGATLPKRRSCPIRKPAALNTANFTGFAVLPAPITALPQDLRRFLQPWYRKVDLIQKRKSCLRTSEHHLHAHSSIVAVTEARSSRLPRACPVKYQILVMSVGGAGSIAVAVHLFCRWSNCPTGS